MNFYFRRLLLVPLCAAPAIADFLGPSYPAPRNLSDSRSHVAESWRNLTSTLEKYLNHENQSSALNPIPGIENITFSLGMFSLHDPDASELQFHYTSPEIATSPDGTHKVDGDSIYRMASVTKVFTVLAGLLELESADWERPLTEALPTLADYASKTPGGSIYTTQWDKITLSALAAQIAGVPRDGFPSQGEVVYRLITGLLNVDPVEQGFPPLTESDVPKLGPCAVENCTPVAYTEGVEDRAPVFLPWTTPAYANNGFALLGLAIANLTGKSLHQIYRESIFEPLGMASSNSSSPPKSEWHRCVIPGNATTSFAYDVGQDLAETFMSSGGLLSTTRDLAKFGTGILNSTLLPSEETRRWLKPVSHTAHLEYSIGRPWEIMRYTHPSGVVTDIYTKLGDSGLYSGYLVLLPDYDAGFSLLASGSSPRRFPVAAAILDAITELVIPALDTQARAEAEQNFAGTYTSTVACLNSSLTLSVNDTDGAAPGLVVSSWISNATDVLDTLNRTFGTPPYRLVPSISDPERQQAAFRLLGADDAPSTKPAKGLFSGPGMISGDWLIIDAATYLGVGENLFVFDTSVDGKAEAVSPAAFQVTLKKAA